MIMGDLKKNWKQSVSFPINYNSADSSEDDIDSDDVVLRRPALRSSRHLLEDGGDGAPADLLGTTPPRNRIRNKEKWKKNHLDMDFAHRSFADNRRYTVDNFFQSTPPVENERVKKRASLKLVRSRERDFKQSGEADFRADSMPSPDLSLKLPTLVESCSRFMSLTSRLKCQAAEPCPDAEDEVCQELPRTRVDFHNTFSMLINMGNVDKGCRRTISREEQVWQNELKDLIWLELQARLAGRTLPQQDRFICTQRQAVPDIVANIVDYRFVPDQPCRIRAELGDEPNENYDEVDKADPDSVYDPAKSGCLSFDCPDCSSSVGKALRETGELLDAFFRALELYPSSKAMTADHPLLATPRFRNTLKAMCLWHNTTMYMRMKIVSLNKMIRAVKAREDRRRLERAGGVDSAHDSEPRRQCTVRFVTSGSDSESPRVSRESDVSHRDDDSGTDANHDLPTPESDVSRYNTVDTTVSNESGYTSSRETKSVLPKEVGDVYNLPDVVNLTAMRLLDSDQISPYKQYLNELLKTQGVRRSTMFIYKMRRHTLNKVYTTLQRLEEDNPDSATETETRDAFEDQKVEDFGVEKTLDAEQEAELRRYGWWSEECSTLRLPSYRGHFLLLSGTCMQVVHDYLQLRLDAKPDQPSCFTVKQVIHELKEGLDIAADMRCAFMRNISVSLAHFHSSARMRTHLANIVHNLDRTVEAVLEQYLDYLRLSASEKVVPRSHWEKEWAFTSRLAAATPSVPQQAPAAFTDIVRNQIELIIKRFECKSKDLQRHEETFSEDSSNEDDKRYFVYTICREAQCIYASERESALQSAQFARGLAARFARYNTKSFLQHRTTIFESLMSLRACIASHTVSILEKSAEAPKDLNDGLTTRVRELMQQVFKLGFELHKEMHRFVVESSPERRKSPGRRTQRPRLLRAESTVDDYDDNMFEQIKGKKQTSIERLISGESVPAPEEDCPQESEEKSSRLEEEWAALVSRAIIHFAKCWMRFVMERCERGRGTRPRWASQGLEFLMLTCDPHNTRHLTDAEFEELKQLMDECISHVIGSMPSTPRVNDPASSRRRPRIHSPFSSNGNISSVSGKGSITPPTPIEQDPFMMPEYNEVDYSRRVQQACQLVDEQRDALLRKGGWLGRLLPDAASTLEPKLRQVTFPWQRGLKIGAGTFGKVYTVINTQSGQLLAMKELSIGAGDRRALQRAANELRVLEGVIHPHLVRYYGCELHTEEMLLFMELCVEGSLEALVAIGALPEDTVRRYSRQLLSALLELHQRQIAHRDVKSGNIFLTNEGNCLKLGDFGCAVKIRANTTACGELQGTVGTQAYMAPEVFMNQSGHGRAADIWSLGCVVTEMASGTRPFAEYDSNYQIMFVVGMGGRPSIPASLSAEGQAFCRSCLTHEPQLRPRAQDLAQHHFLNMMKSDEDCQCKPGQFLTKM